MQPQRTGMGTRRMIFRRSPSDRLQRRVVWAALRLFLVILAATVALGVLNAIGG